MARFRYRALESGGGAVVGALDAPDRAAAVEALRRRGLLPVDVAEGGGFDLAALLNAEITPRRALSQAERIGFTRALATLTGAGLPLDRSLEIVAELGERKAGRAMAARLLSAVRGGAALSAAMAAEGDAFPPMHRAVVQAGEAGAALGPALARLADGEEAAARRRSALTGALIYPAFLMVAAVGAIAVMLLFVVPTFAPLLEDAGAEPPALTRAVMAAGDVFAEGWPLMLAGLLALWLGARAALARPALRRAAAAALLRAPLLGALLAKLASARLARLLAELTQNGVALPAALRLAGAAVPNAAFRAEIARVTPLVEAGRGLARPLAEGGVAAPLAVQLIRVGEESGRLGPMLAKTADILETEASEALDRMLSLLTPALTLVMGVMIALIVSSVLLALLQINELTL
ncbi:type II secretion system F family protein [Rubrimonas cliftonensis]|uniref:Type II secretion system protein F (GspF) n=1 Tax=Rubrimonas cliftonensis TaxID=89524 RepID=A0A1H3WPN6_9RHOB|nr:type II secretion system F family protein [Rubrimonas cliftonensis]SDZ89147.1 type II secretion system protein F (GspF) [Rubrimonas cliftonensis]